MQVAIAKGGKVGKAIKGTIAKAFAKAQTFGQKRDSSKDVQSDPDNDELEEEEDDEAEQMTSEDIEKLNELVDNPDLLSSTFRTLHSEITPRTLTLQQECGRATWCRAFRIILSRQDNNLLTAKPFRRPFEHIRSSKLDEILIDICLSAFPSETFHATGGVDWSVDKLVLALQALGKLRTINWVLYNARAQSMVYSSIIIQQQCQQLERNARIRRPKASNQGSEDMLVNQTQRM